MSILDQVRSETSAFSDSNLGLVLGVRREGKGRVQKKESAREGQYGSVLDLVTSLLQEMLLPGTLVLEVLDRTWGKEDM